MIAPLFESRRTVAHRRFTPPAESDPGTGKTAEYLL
jgi:hypothetical protein